MSDGVNDDDLKKWRDLAAKATPGPWRVSDGRYDSGDVVQVNPSSPIGGRVVGSSSGPGDSGGCDSDDAAFIAAAREAVPALIAEIDRLRDLARQFAEGAQRGGPVKISLPHWVIEDIRVGNVFVPPPTDEDRRREEASALRHDPVIARTMIGGPGNHRRIVACACRAPGVRDEASWAAHVGAPGAADYLKTIFALQDAAQDAVAYPGAETLATLDRVLGRATVVAPGAVSR